MRRRRAGGLRPGGFRRAAALLAAAALSFDLVALPVRALPQGGQAVWGDVEIDATLGGMTVTQRSEKAILHWDSFDIAGGEWVHFAQPSSSAVALNRVLGQDPSALDGRLSADGQLFLINPNGVLFGAGARVDASALVASSLSIRDADFLAGAYRFSGPGGNVANAGEIVVAEGGYVALLGREVENTGTISAPRGSVGLAAGDAATLDFTGDGLVTITVDEAALDAQVANGGLIEAEGGLVVMTARAKGELTRAAINMDGVIRATSLESRGGSIRLLGEGEGAVEVSGVLDVSGAFEGAAGGVSDAAAESAAGDAGTGGAPADGGTIVVTGEHVVLSGTARLDAGGAEGGVILVGGDRYGGRDPQQTFLSEPVRNAATTTVASGAQLRADGIAGDGGAVVVWSDEVTSYLGSISARSLAASGSGGFAEVSGKRLLSFLGTADLRGGPGGAAGTLLLDPLDVTITGAGGSDYDVSDDGTTTTFERMPGLSSEIPASVIETALQSGNVIVTTGSDGFSDPDDGNIYVNASIVWEGPTTLTLSAYSDIVIDNGNGVVIKNIAADPGTLEGSGHLVLRADNSGKGIGTVLFTDYFVSPTGIDFSESGGTVSVYYNPDSNTPGGGIDNANGGTKVNDISYVDASAHGAMSGPYFDGLVDLGDDAVLYAYMLVNTVYDLQNMQNNLLNNPTPPRRYLGYALGRDIDASLTGPGADSDSWSGWVEEEDEDPTQAGFRPIGASGSFAGIFDGMGHTIDGLYIDRGDESFVGLFAMTLPSGFGPTPVIRNVGLTNVKIVGESWVGGLAGMNSGGLIENVFVTGTVEATSGTVGGLVGEHFGTISESWVAANVSTNGDVAGGLVGKNLDIVEKSYFVGRVDGGSIVGGLVGVNEVDATVFQSYSVATVTGTRTLGGLVGQNYGLVDQTYSEGRVAGALDELGGLVGENEGGTIRKSYSTAAVTGSNRIGGLVGRHAHGAIEQSYAAGPVRGDREIGGLVGNMDSGSIQEAYAIGSVDGFNEVGGLVGRVEKLEADAPDPTITHGYWNPETTGQIDGVGNGSGFDFDILAVGSDGHVDRFAADSYDGFDFDDPDPAWDILEGVSYPYLIWRFPNGPSIVSGDVIGVQGGDSGVGVDVGVDGTHITTVWSGANGEYYAAIDPVELESAGIVWLNGERVGKVDAIPPGVFVSVPDRATSLTEFGEDGHITGLNLYAGYVLFKTAKPLMSTVLDRATGDLDDDDGLEIAYTLNGQLEPDRMIDLIVYGTGDTFAIDRAIRGTGSSTVTVFADGDLTLDAGITIETESGWVRLIAEGDLTLAAGASISSEASGSAIALSTGGDFINNAGPDALKVNVDDPDARWLVYVHDLKDNVYGGLNSGNEAIWGTTYSEVLPDEIFETGNRYIFAVRPKLTFTSNNLTKTYGTDVTDVLADPDPELHPGLFTVTGIVEDEESGAFLGDTPETAYFGLPTLSSDGAAADADVVPGGYVITINVEGIETDYELETQNDGILTVTPYELVVKGIAVDPRKYDGTKVVELKTAGWAYDDEKKPFVDDDVDIDFADAYGEFDDKNVGQNKPVTVKNALLTGDDAPNYTLKFEPIVGEITPYELVVKGITVDPRTYDGTKVVELKTAGWTYDAATQPFGGDDVDVDLADAYGEFDDKNVGQSKPVTVKDASLVGDDAGNYTLTFASVFGEITPYELVVTGITVDPRTYDGTKVVELRTAGWTYDAATQPIGGDDVDVDLADAYGEFDDKNVGQNKPVTVKDASLVGDDAPNYTLKFEPIVGEITPYELVVTGIAVDPRTYDGTKVVELKTAGWAYDAATQPIGGDDVDVDLADAYGEFDDKNVGQNKPVTVKDASLVGDDADNYTLTFAPIVGEITPKMLDVSLAGDVRKTYDATTLATLKPANFTLSGVFDGDDVYVSNETGEYDTPNAGNGKIVTVTELALDGDDAQNYRLAAAEVAAPVGVIDKAPLTVRANDAMIKVGDPLPEFTVTYEGFVGGEDETVLGGALSFFTEATEGSPAGEYEVTPGGLSAANYEIEFVPGVLTIAHPGGQLVNELVEELLRQGNPILAALLQDERFASLLSAIGSCRIEDLLNLLAYSRFASLEAALQALAAFGVAECAREFQETVSNET